MSEQQYSTHQLGQRGYDNLLIFLTTMLIFTETNFSSLVRASGHGGVDAKVDEDEVEEEEGPMRLRLRLLLFVLVNQTFLMALLFFLHGRLDQRKWSQSWSSESPGTIDRHFSASYRKILPAVACKLLHGQLRTLWPTNTHHVGLTGTTSVSPIVLLPVLLSSFDFAVGSLLRRLGTGRAAAYLEKFQVDRKRIVPIFWLMHIEADVVLRTLFPVDLLSGSTFCLTDVPQYFFAYVWGRLSVSTGDVHVLAVIPPQTMPIVSMAVSVLFSNLALLDLLSMALPEIAQNDFVNESVQAALRRIGGGTSPLSLMYGIWKGLSLASIGPSLISTFIENSNQDVWVKIPNTGRRLLKRYAYATFIVYLPVGQLLQIGIDAMSTWTLGRWGVLHFLQSCEISALSGVVIVFRGALHALLAWAVGCLLVEYVPLANRML